MSSLATRLAQRTQAWVAGLALTLLVAPLGTRAEIEITLKNSFIEAYKNRATIQANYVIDKAHKKPNPPSKDGDLHVAGRTAEVGLPIVAEIMNAKFQKAVDFVHKNEGTGEPVVIAGAWRIWCEPGGSGPHVQGEPLEPFQTGNPDHVFEIHPITKLGDSSLLDSLGPIVGGSRHTRHDRRATVAGGGLPCSLISSSSKTSSSSSCAIRSSGRCH